MAELNTAPKGDGGKKVRSKKQNPAVDLTAMVDLAFLLITFFMLTTTLSKPQSMNLSMPDKTPPKEETPPAETPAWRTLTVVLGSDDKVAYYIGSIDNPQPGGEPTITAYGKNGIRQVILDLSKKVKARVTDAEKESLVIIIKPSEKSNYKNFVDILDEMAITQEKRYAVVDITEKDINMLIDKQAYN
ncbi:MAG: biopolymer transporter ExbD [Bacteroidota bacterium]|nr:biopolymer transporter ExbD [Bacteroidota bacterium]